MKADLEAFRVALEETLHQSLRDPRDVRWLLDLFMDVLERELAGQTLPTLRELRMAEAERVAKALLQREGAAIAAARQGVHRSTIYRRSKRALARKAA